MAQTDMQTGTVAGFFDSETKAKQAIDELTAAGFSKSQIGMALSSGTGTFGTSLRNEDDDAATSVGSSAKNAARQAGAAGESVWNKVKDFFGGNEAEPYAGEQSGAPLSTREITDEPGYGTGYEDEGYHSDAVHHSLSGLSVPHERASYLGGRLGSGDEGAVVTVTAGDRLDEAEAILERNGADLGNNSSAPVASTPTPAAATGAQNIKLYGEVLRVHKDRISRGEVNVRKEVITEMQTVEVPVTREELVIERVAGTGEMVADGEAFDGQSIRIPLSEEFASVDKQAFVREEVRVGKRDVTDTQSFDESVRREELKIDDQTTPTTTKSTSKF